MADLTDDELELALTIGDRLETMNRRAYVDRESLALAGRLQRAAAEIRRHRAARAADRERVRAVVKDAVVGVTARGRISVAVAMDNASRIADRVADALATPAPALIAERVRAVVRESALPVLEDQAATVVRGGGVLRNGTAERRQALEFCADAIADRVAEQLAGAPNCPRCDSPAPHLHPAVQHGGEVGVCTDRFHLRVTPQNTPEKIAAAQPAPPTTEAAPAVVLSDEEVEHLVRVRSDIDVHDAFVPSSAKSCEVVAVLDRLIAAHRKAP